METDALPIGATGLRLFTFLVSRVFPVKAAIFLDFHFGRFDSLITCRTVILPFAFSTLKLDYISHFFYILIYSVEPGSRIELPTSSLPRKRSTTELPGPWRALRIRSGGERRIRTSEG